MKKEIPLWKYYIVRLDFLTSLCASVPANPDLVDIWLKTRSPKVKPPQSRSITEIQEEVFGTLAIAEEEIPKSLLVFQRVAGCLVVRAATLRAHIKDCARQVSVYYVGKIQGEKSFSTRVINCVYHDETQYWINLLDSNDQPFTEATGRRDKPVHTWQGNSLKTIEYIENAHLRFTLKVFGGKVSEDDLRTVFNYGGTHGYAGERGDGEGRYIATITEIPDERE